MFTVQRIGEIISQLAVLRHPQRIELTGWKISKQKGETKPTPTDAQGVWEEIPDNGVWGGNYEYYAFAGDAVFPSAFAGKVVEFIVTTGKEDQWAATNPQFSLYVDGILRQGFDGNHYEYRLTENAVAGEAHEIFLSAFSGSDNYYLQFKAEIAVLDPAVEKLYYDLLVPWETMSLLPHEDPAYIELADILTKAINRIDLRKPGSEAYYESITAAEKLLVDRLYTTPRTAEAVVRCIGHTHIDVAWMWTLSVTEDKSVRSFSTVLELMRRYPEYLFMSSQPQLYQYVKKNAPEIYEEIKERVAEGRWEVEGSFFVEPDCNLSSGEALVRQVLYGKRFFKKEFGKDNRILWLPDVFGYSAALPQIMKKSGIEYFMTTKISWNEVNQMPYDTFYWKGIDGTKILTHFIPTRNYILPNGSSTGAEEHQNFYTTYVGEMCPRHIMGGWQRYQQKNLNREYLCAYGWGDGGGGPTADMLEQQRRMAYGIPGCPRTMQSKAIDFFDNLKKDLDGQKVPIWSGELYLEYHRGTNTSMARNKKWNRRGEFALTNVETEAVVAGKLCGAAYPDLQEPWEILMRNQFHDILPGSSIWEVYEDSKAEYEKLFAITGAQEQKNLQMLADGVGETIVWNPNGQAMSGFVVLDADDSRVQTQKTAEGKFLAWVENVPSKGYAVLTAAEPACGKVTICANRVETPYADITFNEHGHITSWYDKVACRQILQENQCGNVLMTYEDKPFQFDNWNLQDYYKEKSWPVEDLRAVQVIENGPYRYALKLDWQYLDTPISEIVYFYANSPRVDFCFHADWKEDQLVLKALFPLEVNSTEATFEIQYGNVKRPTVSNTSWDTARFEVCHQKWMDVSEGGYGISILNDCKYGVSVEENVVGLTLLKSGRYPNPVADREVHDAVYSVLPHTGSWQEAGTVAEAYQLNNPLFAVVPEHKHNTLPSQYSVVSHKHRNIMIESVKKAEDSDGTIIRLYEFENTKTNARLQLGTKAKKVWRCNLMEEKEALLAENTDVVNCPVDPFGIETLLIEEEGEQDYETI